MATTNNLLCLLLSSPIECADYLELKSTLTDPGLDTRFRGNGTIIYRHSLRVWQLPAFTLVGEFRTGEANAHVQLSVHRPMFEALAYGHPQLLELPVGQRQRCCALHHPRP